MWCSNGIRKVLVIASSVLVLCVGSQAQPAPGAPTFQRLADINPGPAGSAAGSYIVCDSTVAFFSANSSGDRYPQEIWRTDGSPGGTFRLWKGETGVIPLVCLPGKPGLFALQVQGTVLRESYRLLWIDDPSGTAVELEKDLSFSVFFPLESRGEVGLLQSAGLIFLSIRSLHGGSPVLVSDGSPEGTRRLEGLPEDLPEDPTRVRGYQELGGAMYFRVGHSGHSGLWMSDGTTSWPVDEQLSWHDLASTPRGLVLSGYISGEGSSLWVVDEVGAKPRRLSGPTSFLTHHVSLEDGRSLWEVLFPGELWITDGTEAGTQKLMTLRTPTTFHVSYVSDNFVELGGQAFFLADDGVEGWEVWQTDGTPEGTKIAIDTCSGPCTNLGPSSIYKVRNMLSFALRDPERGAELALSDGTESGTRVLDVCPGPRGMRNLSWQGSTAVKFAWVLCEEEASPQVYQLDSSSETMEKLTSSPPEILSRYGEGRNVAVLGSRLVTTATDAEAGAEPWVVRAFQPPVTEIPALGLHGYAVLITLLAVSGLFLVAGRRAL